MFIQTTRRFLITVVVLAMVPVAWIMSLPASPVLANTTCGTSTASNFLGYWESGSSGWGAASYITTRGGSFCNGTNPLGSKDFITAWSMITNPSYGRNGDYAQSGYITFNNGDTNHYIFAEYSDNDDQCDAGGGNYYCRKVTSTTTSGGDDRYYYSIYDNPAGAIAMSWIDGSGTKHIIQTTYYDPTYSPSDNHWPSPWTEQFFGENHNVGDDMPGSISYQTTFQDVAFGTSKWSGSGSLPFQNVADHPVPYASPSKAYWCGSGDSYDDSTFYIWTRNPSC
jgi:hypothetical protein